MCIRAKRVVEAFTADIRALNWGAKEGASIQTLHGGVLALAAKFPDPKLFKHCGDCPACLKEAAAAEKWRGAKASYEAQKAVDDRFPNLSEHNRVLDHQRVLRDDLLVGKRREPVVLTGGRLFDYYAQLMASTPVGRTVRFKYALDRNCMRDARRSCTTCKPKPVSYEDHQLLREMCGVVIEAWPNGTREVTLYPDSESGRRAFVAVPG